MAFVQAANSGTPAGSATSKTANFASAQTASNLNAVMISYGATGTAVTQTVSSIIDSSGNVYVQGTPRTNFIATSGDGDSIQIWYCANIAAALAGANTVTVTLSATAPFFIIGAMEISGLATTQAIDISGSGSANGPVGSSNAFLSAIQGIATRDANDYLLQAWAQYDGAGTVGAGWTQRIKQYTLLVQEQISTTTGAYTGNSTAGGGSGYGTAFIAFRNSGSTTPVTPTGEVVVNGNAFGLSTGNNGTLPVNLFDANGQTAWNASAGTLGLDAGVATTMTRIRVSADPVNTDMVLGFNAGAQTAAEFIQGSNIVDFSTGNTTIFTFTARPTIGTLLNEYIVTPGATFRYYRLNFLAGANGVSDMEFYVAATAGVFGACAPPVITPNVYILDQPTRIRITSLTTNAQIYYTLDGSTPTSASTLYASPFVLSTTTTVKAIAILAGQSNSRVVQSIYAIPGTIISTNKIMDNRNYEVWARDGYVTKDPVSGWWYRVGDNQDSLKSASQAGNLGQSLYHSADLRNWFYDTIVLQQPAGTALLTSGASNGAGGLVYAGNTHIFYCAASGLYVLWTVSFPNGIFAYTSSSILGPYTQAQNYTSLHGVTGVTDDLGLFMDTDGVSLYLIALGNNNLQIIFSKLNTANYTAVDGVNFAVYNVSGGPNFGEAQNMIRRGSTYFLMVSGITGWVANANVYLTATSPIGPFTTGANPYQPFAGGNPDNTTSFNSQCNQIIQIPGRTDCSFIYADRYDEPIDTTFNSWVKLMLPITFPTSTTMTVTWQPAWNFDTAFPTISGAPAAATGLSVTGSVASWTNNEALPAMIYLDSANDAGFSSNVASEALAVGATTFTITAPGTFYRIRTVNTAGSSLSSNFPISAGGSTSGSYSGWNADLAMSNSDIDGLSKSSASKDSHIPEGLRRIYEGIQTQTKKYFRI